MRYDVLSKEYKERLEKNGYLDGIVFCLKHILNYLSACYTLGIGTEKDEYMAKMWMDRLKELEEKKVTN